MASDRPEWTRADYDGPTPPLVEFLAAYEQDDNVWWCMGSGHHMNLFDAAVAEAERLRAIVAAVEALHTPVVLDGVAVCRTCRPNGVPCPTRAALDGGAGDGR